MDNRLIVEKNEEQIQRITEAHEGEFKLTFCGSTKEAVEILKHKIPKLILVEESKPDISASDVIEYVKRISELSQIPIIVFSDGEDEIFEKRCIHMGASDFIFLPCSKVGIRSRVNRVLSLEQKNRRIAQVNAEVDLMRDMAKRDPLTKLLNRTFAEEYINEFLSERRHHGTLLMIDMDNFKEINDVYGHIVGDEILIEFANTLKALTRQDDVVCRLGGDEFMVFLKDVSVHSVVVEKVEQIVVTLEKRLVKPNNGGHVSVSTGIATSPLDGRSFNQLYQNADKALYYVKKNNKGSYHFFSEEGAAGGNRISKKNTQVDLEHLQAFIQEVGYKKGAYQVEYDGFKKIYRFIARCIGRRKQNVQTVLFTLNNREGILPDVQELVFAMDNLKNAVHASIRHADVATNYSNSQFVVILMDSSYENADMVAKRITDKYNELHQYNEDIEVVYDIQTVAPAPKDNDF